MHLIQPFSQQLTRRCGTVVVCVDDNAFLQYALHVIAIAQWTCTAMLSQV